MSQALPPMPSGKGELPPAATTEWIPGMPPEDVPVGESLLGWFVDLSAPAGFTPRGGYAVVLWQDEPGWWVWEDAEAFPDMNLLTHHARIFPPRFPVEEAHR